MLCEQKTARCKSCGSRLTAVLLTVPFYSSVNPKVMCAGVQYLRDWQQARRSQPALVPKRMSIEEVLALIGTQAPRAARRCGKPYLRRVCTARGKKMSSRVVASIHNSSSHVTSWIDMDEAQLLRLLRYTSSTLHYRQ